MEAMARLKYLQQNRPPGFEGPTSPDETITRKGVAVCSVSNIIFVDVLPSRCAAQWRILPCLSFPLLLTLLHALHGPALPALAQLRKRVHTCKQHVR